MIARLSALRVVLAAVLLPVAIILSHRNVPIPLTLIALGGVLALPRFRPRRVGVILLAFVGWAILTCFWSPYDDAMSWPPYLLAVGVLGVLLSLPASQRHVGILMTGVVVSIVLVGFEAATGGLIRDLVPPEGRPDKDDVATARGITATIALAPAALLFLWQAGRRRLAGALLLPLGLAAFSFDISANALAFLAGLGAAGLAAVRPGFVVRALVAAAVLGFVLMPTMAALLPPLETVAGWELGPASWRMRLVAWKATSNGLMDGFLNLVFGHGVEAARVLGEKTGTFFVAGATAGHDAIPTHPHNVFLQIWHDLGLVGVGLVAAAILEGGRALYSLRGPAASAAAALIAIVLVLAAVDASLWTLWRVAAPLLSVWALVALARAPAAST